jgi:hypothetical protein
VGFGWLTCTLPHYRCAGAARRSSSGSARGTRRHPGTQRAVGVVDYDGCNGSSVTAAEGSIGLSAGTIYSSANRYSRSLALCWQANSGGNRPTS